MTLSNRHYEKDLLFIIMIGLAIYFWVNSCTPKPDIHISTPSEQDSIAQAKADSLLNDSLQKAGGDTVYKDTLSVVTNIDTTKK